MIPQHTTNGHSRADGAAWPDSQTFWRHNRVIVTGGAGFLGRYVVTPVLC